MHINIYAIYMFKCPLGVCVFNENKRTLVLPLLFFQDVLLRTLMIIAL